MPFHGMVQLIILTFLTLLTQNLTLCKPQNENIGEIPAENFVVQAEAALQATSRIKTLLEWAYATEATEANEKQLLIYKV